jgi:hypothetical protein
MRHIPTWAELDALTKRMDEVQCATKDDERGVAELRDGLDALLALRPLVELMDSARARATLQERVARLDSQIRSLAEVTA